MVFVLPVVQIDLPAAITISFVRRPYVNQLRHKEVGGKLALYGIINGSVQSMESFIRK